MRPVIIAFDINSQTKDKDNTLDEQIDKILELTKPISQLSCPTSFADIGYIKQSILALIQSVYMKALPASNQSVDESGLDRDLLEYDKGWNDCLTETSQSLQTILNKGWKEAIDNAEKNQ